MIYLNLDQLMVTQAALTSYLEALRDVEPSDDADGEAQAKLIRDAEEAQLAVTLDLARKSQFA
jgi:hypothetical protein